MSKLNFIIILIFSLLCVLNCDDSENEKVSFKEKDKLKVFFYNLSKKGIDSLSDVISKEIMTSKGLDAKKLFANIAEKDTMSYEFYSQYAFFIAINGDPVNALKYLNLGASKTKNKSRLYFDKALVWAYIEPLGKRDSMYKYLSFAINQDALNGYYYAARSKFYNEDEDNMSALNDINKAIKLDPNDTSYINQRGVYKIVLKDYKGALDDLKFIAYRNKETYDIYMYRAIIFNKLKMHKEALEESNKCIKLNPSVGPIYLIRGNARYNLSDTIGGLNDIRKSASLGNIDAINYMKKHDEYHKNHKQI